MIQQDENDRLNEDHDALAVRREGIVLPISLKEGRNMSNVVYHSGNVLGAFEIKGVHVQTDNTATANNGENLGQFHHNGPENDEVSHHFAHEIGNHLQTLQREDGVQWVPYSRTENQRFVLIA